jgi:hypothetical protein
VVPRLRQSAKGSFPDELKALTGMLDYHLADGPPRLAPEVAVLYAAHPPSVPNPSRTESAIDLDPSLHPDVRFPGGCRLCMTTPMGA